MLSYYLSGSNNYTIRTDVTSSATNGFTMSLQDMTTLVNTTASLSDITYKPYESVLSFTASLERTITGEEYRATIINGNTEIWHGSLQVFRPQTIDKANYTNQNDGYISNVSTNEYIIMD
jgi:hypothetical protein